MNASPDTPRATPFVFHGRGGEYFRIWIVNVCLSVLTLGVYTAWAKVRMLRYFYGNLELDGHVFAYHAKPGTILRGRLVALVVLIVYQVAANFEPFVAGLLALGFVALIPWLINASARFNARMSSYRSVRFGFRGSYGRALWVYVLFPVLAALTLGLLLPAAARARAAYLANNYRYGDRAFAAKLGLGRYYAIYAEGGLILLSGLLVLLALGYATGILEDVVAAVVAEDVEALSGQIETLAVGVIPFLVLLVLVIANVMAARQLNYVFNRLALDGRHRFVSTLSPWRFAWIRITNAIAVAVTLGLALPWARVRLARYRAARLTFLAAAGLETIVQGAAVQGSVVGEEMAEMWDVEVAI